MSQLARQHPFSRIRSGRIFEDVLDQVREAIFSGHYGPGEKLPTELELAALFGVSRAGVREALRVLELSGLVVVRHGGVGGVFVAEVPARPVGLALHTLFKHQQFNVQELFAAKIFFEERMAEEAARQVDDRQLALLRDNLERNHTALDQGGLALDESMEFHLLLAGVLNNRVLDEMLHALVDLVETIERSYAGDSAFYRTMLIEHQEIYEALRSHRPRLAGHAMVRHLKTVETKFLIDERIGRRGAAGKAVRTRKEKHA